MPEQALRIASHIPHAAVVAAVACAIAVIAFVFLQRARKPVIAWILLVGLVALGMAPLVADSYVRSRGVYHVQVVVLKPDQSVIDSATVKSANGGDLKMVDGGWELVFSPQTKPADGKVTLSASVKDEFLSGKSTLILGDDYYPSAKIQLTAETSAKVRGVVVDENLQAVAGARVLVAGYPDLAVTDSKGNFVLPAHAAKGQMVTVEAKKDQLTGRVSAAAGKTVEVILSPE